MLPDLILEQIAKYEDRRFFMRGTDVPAEGQGGTAKFRPRL